MQRSLSPIRTISEFRLWRSVNTEQAVTLRAWIGARIESQLGQRIYRGAEKSFPTYFAMYVFCLMVRIFRLMLVLLYIYKYIYIYTGCPRRNVPDFGRVFLMLNYTDITQNTYVQSWTVTEIMAREVWNFDSCYTLIDYKIHIKTGRNVWFL